MAFAQLPQWCVKALVVLAVGLAAVVANAQITLRMPFENNQWWGPTTYQTRETPASQWVEHPAWGTTNRRMAIDWWYLANQSDSQATSPPFGWTQGSSSGKPVLAAHAGVVRRRQLGTGYGNYVVIRSNDNGDYLTLYAHLADFGDCPDVGQPVSVGQTIGHVGLTGSTTNYHLHFELLKEQVAGSRTNGTWVAQDISGLVLDGQAVNFANWVDLDINTSTFQRWRGQAMKALGAQPANIWWTSTPPSGRWYRTNERLAYSWSGTNPTVVEWPAVGNLGEIYVAEGGLGWRQYGARAYNGNGDVTIIWDGGWDDVGPTASQIAGPAPGAWVNGSPSVTWRCSDAHAGVRRFWYRWDGGAWQGPWGGTDGTVGLPEGEHVLETLVEDHAFTGGTELGNQAVVGLGTFRRDSVAPVAGPPAFSPSSPSAASSITIQVAATDDRSGVQRIEVSANGALVGTIAGGSGSVVWNAEASPDGDYTIRARAFDQAGNSHDATAVYTLDRAAPDTFASLTPASPDGMNGWYLTRPTMTLTTNAASGATTRYRVGDGAWTPYGGPFAVQPEGDQTVTFQTTSRSGVVGPLRTLRLKVDSSAPANPSLIDEGDLSDSSSELNVTVANPDPESGVWRMTYRVGTAPLDDSLWPETTVATNGPFLNADGLFVPPGTTVFVSLRVQNAAGAWSDWAATDGIVMDPRESLYLIAQRVFASAGGPASDDTYTVDGTLGETAVGELLTDNADGLLLAGFWSGGAGRTLSVAVDLQFYGADATGLPVDVRLFEPGTLNEVAAFVVPLGLDGVIRVDTTLWGVYDVRVKASHWLARRILGVEIGAPGLAVSLPNGDINDDNAIDLDDFLILAAAYETVEGDPAFVPPADLNGDEAINLDDFLILAAGYETVGD